MFCHEHCPFYFFLGVPPLALNPTDRVNLLVAAIGGGLSTVLRSADTVTQASPNAVCVRRFAGYLLLSLMQAMQYLCYFLLPLSLQCYMFKQSSFSALFT